MTSETTKNYGLPHYKPTDHPDFLGEINAAYKQIDTVMYDNKQAIEALKRLNATLEGKVKTLEEQVKLLQGQILQGRV